MMPPHFYLAIGILIGIGVTLLCLAAYYRSLPPTTANPTTADREIDVGDENGLREFFRDAPP